MPHPIPKRPWENIGIDILEYKNALFLVVIDYYTKWTELLSLRFKSVKDIIFVLSKIFCRYGFPDLIESDNSPFNSFEFKCILNNVDAGLITTGLKDIKAGDVITFRKDNKWVKGRVIAEHEAPRSYIVEGDGGVVSLGGLGSMSMW